MRPERAPPASRVLWLLMCVLIVGTLSFVLFSLMAFLWDTGIPASPIPFILADLLLSTAMIVWVNRGARAEGERELKLVADARRSLPSPPESPDQREQLVQKRAMVELTMYKKAWSWFAALTLIPLVIFTLFTTLLQMFLRYYPKSGIYNADLFAGVTLIAYAYLIGTSAAFIGYPSRTRIQKIFSGWRTDPDALNPLYTEEKRTVVVPNSIALPLAKGLAPFWVTDMLALSFLYWYWFSGDPNLVPLLPYWYLLAALGFVGMVLHRLHATRAVRSALAGHAHKTL